MDALEAIKNRYSVREFKDKPVSKDLIEIIVDCGRLAPTARKEEPWEFIVVTEKNKLRELADITDHGKFIVSSAFAIAVFCRETKYYLEDGCAATENMLVAAASLAVGSCWVAGDKKEYCGKVAESLSVPEGLKLVSLIAFGYPKEGQAAIEKRPLKAVLHWQKF